MNESYLMVLSEIANSLERIAEAMESIEENTRVAPEMGGSE